MEVTNGKPMMDISPNGHVNVWSLDGGAVAASVRGPDGAAITVLLKTGTMDLDLVYEGRAWHQTIVYRGLDGHGVSDLNLPVGMDLEAPSQPTDQPPRPDGRPRGKAGRPRLRPLSMDQVTGADSG